MITEEQRKKRKESIGSSDAAAILGLSRWKTPLEVWSEKTGAVEPEDISDKLPIIIGNELEDVVAKLFTLKTGKKVHRVNETVYDKEFPFLAVNLDRRVVGEDAVLEAKTCGAWAAKEWSGEEDIPQEVIVQVLFQLMVTGKQRGYAAVLIGGNQDFRWRVVERDEKVIRQIRVKCVEFWQKYIVPRVMPQVVTKDDAPVLYRLFPHGQEVAAIELGEEVNRLADSIKGLQADEKVLKGVIEKEKNMIKAIMGENAAGMSDRFKITWKNQTTLRLDQKELKDKEPDIYSQYATPSQSRVLRIAAIKPKK